MIHSLPKAVGVWGLGIVGHSVITYLRKHGHDVGVMDKKEPSAADAAWLKSLGVRFFSEQSDKELFFASYTTIVPSAGIDVRPYLGSTTVFISELDLFAVAFKGKIIGITGTIAKTSVTTLVTQALRHTGMSVVMGGNIGVGLMDLVDEASEYAVLELSSFQLERARTFVADCAIITNFFPNHLDRHGTEAEYWAAKKRLVTMQKPGGIVLAHGDVLDRLTLRDDLTYAFFSDKAPATTDQHIWFYYDEHGNVVKRIGAKETVIFQAQGIPTISFPSNWLIVVALFDLSHIACPLLTSIPFELPDHRLHCVATINDIAFYDDSKSTIPQSTLAAVKRLASKPVILLVGGLSKGVDRRPFIAELKPYIKSVVCFGKEAAQLYSFARDAEMSACQCATLEEAVTQAYAIAQAGDQIVLSPAGSSFDLFANYHERGVAFAALVERLKH